MAAQDLTVMNAYQVADAAALPGLTAPPVDVTGAILPITAAPLPQPPQPPHQR